MIERPKYLEFLKSLKDKKIIKVITGIRRCGKSTLFEQFKEYLIQNNVSKEQIISINFEDPQYRNILTWEDLYDYIDKRLIKDKKNYIFLDEIQTILKFERAVDGLYLKDNVDIYITGSNSYMLSGELATYLTGRYMQLHMIPLSFKEIFESQEEKNEQKMYEWYIKNGGFPYITNLENNPELIKNYLEGVFNTVLMKDVIAKNNIESPMILTSLTDFLADNIGNLISTKKISDTLKSNGRNNSVNTIENYIMYLTDSYIFYKVGRYDIKGKQYLSTGDKYYISDLGLRFHILGEINNRGSILENVVFLELKRKGYDIYVGKYDNKEIDFIIKNAEGIKYIQVCESLRDKNTLNRELSSLQCIPDNYPKYLITLDYDTANYDGIKQINIYDFLLGNTEI